MEITDLNNGKYLGFRDYETSIFIDEKNYKQKFNEYLENPNDERWEKIAQKGRDHTLKNFNNDEAVKKLILLIDELL